MKDNFVKQLNFLSDTNIITFLNICEMTKMTSDWYGRSINLALSCTPSGHYRKQIFIFHVH